MNKHSLTSAHLLHRSLLSYLLYPASCIYAGYLLFRRKYLFPKPFRAPFKVLSIGNITSGGSGKTPLTIALAKALQARGLKVGIASRGYQAAWENRAAMIFDGQKLLTTIQNAGDEACMVASQVPGIPVFVGRNRSAVLQLIAKHKLDLIILDDALQHLKVARDLDLVVFDSQVGLGNGFVIPAGYLREPLCALPNEAIILLHSKNCMPTQCALKQALTKLKQPVFQVQSRATKLLSGNQEQELKELQGKGLSLVSGIAHPDSFEDSVRALGLSFAHHYRFADHFAFRDAKAMAPLLKDESDFLLSTQKDAIKLQEHPLLASKILCLCLETSLDADLVDAVCARLGF